ncbi:MAG: GTP 3',8-cyclase MoaA [Solirubrobacterales bacterium]
MIDRLGRKIDYLRVSLTDRCNLRCQYCMPEKGVALKPHDEILRLEEVAHLVRVAASIGITRVRLTGGEPLIRRNLLQLIREIDEIPGINDLSMTTNAQLLAPMAQDLAAAGLDRINISLDTLRPERYHSITRGGDLKRALQGLDASLTAGFNPVKINCVALRGFNDDEISDFCQLAADLPIHVRFIEYMPIGGLGFWTKDRFLPLEEIRAMVERHVSLVPEVSDTGAGPAQTFAIQSGAGRIGFIASISSHFCAECNRLRLTADGKLRSCLHSSREIDVKTALRSDTSDQGLAELFSQSVASKPARHRLDEAVKGNEDRNMFEIGG